MILLLNGFLKEIQRKCKRNDSLVDQFLSIINTPSSPLISIYLLTLPNDPNSPVSSHSVHTYEPPEFDFSLYMFSFQKQLDLEKQIAAIDLALADTQPYQYQIRTQLRNEKELLLEQLKGKQKIKDSQDTSPISKAVSFHEPATVYRNYPDKHESRQRYRLSTRETLKAMIKEKQQAVKQLCTEISEL